MDKPVVLGSFRRGINLWGVCDAFWIFAVVLVALATRRPPDSTTAILAISIAVLAAFVILAGRLYAQRNRVRKLTITDDGTLSWRTLIKSGKEPVLEVLTVAYDEECLSHPREESETKRNSVTVYAKQYVIGMDWLSDKEFEEVSRLLQIVSSLNPAVDSRRRKQPFEVGTSGGDPTYW